MQLVEDLARQDQFVGMTPIGAATNGSLQLDDDVTTRAFDAFFDVGSPPGIEDRVAG